MPAKRKGAGGRRRTTDQMKKDAEALRLYCQGKSYQEVADIIGWANKGTAYNAVKRASADIQRDALDQVDHLTAAIERIHMGLRRCQEIIDTRHFAVSASGKIVTDAEGNPVLDSGPKQRAITEMRHLNDQLIMLMDLRPAAKQRVEVVTEDVVDREIAKLAKELSDAGKTPGNVTPGQ